MSNFDKERASYWANIDTESGDHVDERGTRISRLATQDWRGHWLREALDRIEELERALAELLEAGGAYNDLTDRADNDPELMAAGVCFLAAQLAAANALGAAAEVEGK